MHGGSVDKPSKNKTNPKKKTSCSESQAHDPENRKEGDGIPPLQGLGARIGTGRQVEQGPIAIPFQKTIEIFPESISPGGIVASEVLQIGAHEDQAACATLAFFGIDTDLSAANLALQEAFLFAPELLQFRFALGETIL